MNHSKEIKMKESTDCKIDANFKKRDYSKVLRRSKASAVVKGELPIPLLGPLNKPLHWSSQ
jgi:hypothetical protein